MGKHIRSWDEMKYCRRLNQGCGNGEGELYKPWLSIQDFSSQGTVSRVLGWKTNRIHHFMSNNELRYFYQLEWSDSVLDIREQFPLLDVFTTVDIANRAGIKHPIDNKSGFPYVLTTDFLITTRKGLSAKTVKMSSELHDKRVLEKLEIERRYWTSKGVDWHIVTEHEISIQKAQNIEWLHNSKNLNGLPLSHEIIDNLLLEIKSTYEYIAQPVMSICEQIDKKYNVSSGTCLKLFKYLVANKMIDLDLDMKLNLKYHRTDTFMKVVAV